MYYYGGAILLSDKTSDSFAGLSLQVANELIASFPPEAGWHVDGIELSLPHPDQHFHSAATIADFWTHYPGQQVVWWREQFSFYVSFGHPVAGYTALRFHYPIFRTPSCSAERFLEQDHSIVAYRRRLAVDAMPASSGTALSLQPFIARLRA